MNFVLKRERVRVAQRGPIALIPAMKGAICCNWAPFVHFLATDSMRQLFVQSCGTGAVPFLALKERNRFTRDSSEKS